MSDGTSRQVVLQGVRRGVAGETPATPSAVCVLATRAGRELCVVQVRLRQNTHEKVSLMQDVYMAMNLNEGEAALCEMFRMISLCPCLVVVSS